MDAGSYRVLVAEGLLDRVGEIARECAPAHRYALITDDVVAPLYAARVASALGGDSSAVTIAIPAGELHKTRATWASVTDQMLAAGLGRDSAIVALGGGVVGDVAGFVAATFMRGVPYVQVPTTLLAMVDASIGGKTAVDTPAGKNLVGAFHQPAAVVADPTVLRTLSDAHLRAGFAEVIKHGVIADGAYFDDVVRELPRLVHPGGAGWLDAMSDVVARSVEIKLRVVRHDEREAGARKTLNFGHTLGHAIEHCDGYAMLHGEAVAAGMVLEAAIAERLSIAEPGTTGRVRDAVRAAGLPTRAPAHHDAGLLVAATRADKKARAGVVEYALPARVGAMACGDRGWACPVSDEVVLEVLR